MKRYYLKERIGSRWISLKEGQSDTYDKVRENQKKYQKQRKHEVKICESTETII